MAGKGADKEMFRATGKRSAAIREGKEMSLGAVAELAGCSKQHVMNLEVGKRRLTPELAVTLAKALGVKVKPLDGPCAYCAGTGQNLHVHTA